MRKNSALLVFFAVLLPACRTRMKPADDPALYLEHLVASLGRADENRMPQSQVAPSSWEELIPRGASYDQRAQMFEQASAEIAPFVTSGHPEIQKSAIACQEIYTGLARMDREALEQMKAYQNHETPWEFGAWTNDAAARRAALWARYNSECIDPALTSVVFDPNVNPPRIRMRKADMQETVTHIFTFTAEWSGNEATPPILAAARISKLLSGEEPSWISNYSGGTAGAPSAAAQAPSIESLFQEALRQKNRGDKSLAQITLAKADSQIQSLTDEAKKEEYMQQLCSYQIGIGYADDALMTLRRLSAPARRTELTAYIAQHYVGKDNDQARRLYQEAATTAQQIPDQGARDSQLAQIAYFQKMHKWNSDAAATASQIINDEMREQSMKGLN